MAAYQESHISDNRFAEYITELHEFSGIHRIPCGKPNDVAELLQGLRSSEAFASEFGAMVRSIVLREQFKASEFELLTVVAVAWGGIPKDHLANGLPPLIEELRGVMQDLLRHGAIGTPGPIEPLPDKSDAKSAAPPDDKTARELGPISPDGQIYQRLRKIQDSSEPRASDSQPDSASQRGPSSPREELASPIAPAQERQRISARRGFAGTQSPAVPVVDEQRPGGASGSFRLHGYPSEPHGIARTRRLDLNAGEIIAAGLTGLVVALLLTVGSLPIYRARVSVDLSPTDPAASQMGIDVDSPAYALASGKLPGQVAELLLERPHPNPILRQDALSRGMRDLNLGGNEPILYAELVAETAHQVKVRRVNSPHVYEITCESWSAQFAATFCNELLGMLNQQPPTQSRSDSAQGTGLVHTIDAAVGPGVQVYPHWYLQSFAGLVIGCLAGVGAGFIKRAEPESDSDEEAGEE